MKKLEKGLWYFFLQKLLYLLWNLYSWRKKCGQVGTLPLLGLKQELLYNTLYQIPFIKYHLSNTICSPNFFFKPMNESINQSTKNGISAVRNSGGYLTFFSGILLSKDIVFKGACLESQNLHSHLG